jgi:hypothetical protein
LQATIGMLEMDEMENINYLQAIKRITGLSHGTLANEEI